MKSLISLFMLICMASSTMMGGVRVLFIGDSITDGAWGNSGKWNASTEERNQNDMNHIYGHGYMMLCASYYQAVFPHEDMVFWNRGISGNTLADVHGRWNDDVLMLEPDVVSILIGTNDVEKALNNGAEMDFAAWEGELRHLLDTTRMVLPGVRFVLCTPFVARAGRLKASPDFEARTGAIGHLAQCMRDIAKDYNAVVVDFHALFAELQQGVDPERETYWIWDGIHPTPAGHYKMAELWKEKVGKLKDVGRW